MKENVFEGKDKEEVLTNGLQELGKTKDDVLYYVTTDKVGLLKREVTKVHIVELTDVVTFVKDYLTSLTKDMGLEVTFETKIREGQITIRMYSNNNNILIGHNGKTLQALTTIVKQVVFNKIHTYPYILLDVENYKEKQEKYLIRLAKNIAREVSETKNPVSMENMNSYERRIVHNTLGEDTRVYTSSEGEEPNRHVVVYPKES